MAVQIIKNHGTQVFYIDERHFSNLKAINAISLTAPKHQIDHFSLQVVLKQTALLLSKGTL